MGCFRAGAGGVDHIGAPGSVGGGPPNDDDWASPSIGLPARAPMAYVPWGGVGLVGGVASGVTPVGGVTGCSGSGRGCSAAGGDAAGIGMAASLVASGVVSCAAAAGAVSGAGSLTGPSVVLSFWSSVMSSVLRLSSGGPGSPRHAFDPAGLYARSEKVMTRINVVCARGTPVKTGVGLQEVPIAACRCETFGALDAPTGLRFRSSTRTIGGPMETAIFDADSHLMETPEWLCAYAEEGVRDRLGSLGFEGAGAGAAELMAKLPALWESHRHLDIGPEVLKGPKGWMAPGALDAEVRSRVLDALAIDAQLVFPTFALGHFARSRDPEVLYGGTEALNRAMRAFCSTDPRLKAVGLPAAQRPGAGSGSTRARTRHGHRGHVGPVRRAR